MVQTAPDVSGRGTTASPPEKVEFSAGTHISLAAERLVNRASAVGAACGSFNGIELTAKAGDAPEAIVAAYQAESEAAAERLRNSPEGRAAAEASAAEVVALQTLGEQLIGALPQLDFSDHAAVIGWLEQLQPCTDRIGVRLDTVAVVEAFANEGLTPNACCGAAFNPDDEETVFMWLVGQALDGLDRGPAIHGVFNKFAADWRRKFGPSIAA